MTSDHLDISSVWKSLVASCVCVWLKFERAFSTCSFPAQNAFVVFSPAINAFVGSVLSLSEKNSRGYLATGDKRVRL